MSRWSNRFICQTRTFSKRLQPHWRWGAMISTASFLMVLANATFGTLKPSSACQWLDILGEGSLALFVLIWMTIVLASRQPGRTTRWLASGLLGMFCSSFQDVMDEIFHLPDTALWGDWLESFPLGLMVLVVGLLFWYREQRQLITYLQKRGVALQNQTSLNEDSLLPQWDSLAKAVQQQPAFPFTLVALRIAPELGGQPPLTMSDLSKLRFLIAELLLWNLPSGTQVFHIAGEQYALLAEHSLSQEQVYDVVLLLRALRFHGANRSKMSLLNVQSSTALITHSLNEAALGSKYQELQTYLASNASDRYCPPSPTAGHLV